MNACRLCSALEVRELLDCGPQPVGKRYLRSLDQEEYLHPLILAQCDACGTIQLVNPVPAAELKPRFDWITYNEPEGHLDRLTEILVDLPGLNQSAIIGGVSFKDDSTLARLHRLGFQRTWRLDPKTDLGVGDRGVGVETIQDQLTPELADRIVQARGPSDLLIVRHILEHAQNPLHFLRALSGLVRPGGYLVFEVPDCEQALEIGDYTTLWEEHMLYFTTETFQRSFARVGLAAVRFECYPYPFENSLVAVVQRAARPAPVSGTDAALDAERERARHFAREFPGRRARLKRFLADSIVGTGPIAIFGAGHLACTFVFLLELGKLIEFFVDDNPHKQGLFMPGSRLPILGSPALIERGIKLCLLSVNPEAEERVIRKHQAFVDRGGAFASIFPASKHALKISP